MAMSGAVEETRAFAAIRQREVNLSASNGSGIEIGPPASVKYHRLVDSRHLRTVVTWRRAAFLVPLITTAFALTLVADAVAPDRSTALEAMPTPPQTCTSSLQALIDATPTGGTLTVPACIYRESVTIRQPITINGYGAIIDGRDTAGNLVRSTWLSVAANDVTVRGFTMRYANGTYATGSVENAVGVQRFRLEDCDLGFSYVNLNLTGSDRLDRQELRHP